MDGIFAGVEAKVTDWSSVLAEHDGKENHAAILVAIPKSLISSVKVEGMLDKVPYQKETSLKLCTL